MSAQLRHVDFFKRRLSIEVRSLTTRDRKRLQRYIRECVALGFRTIHLKSSPKLRPSERKWLREFSNTYEGATIVRGRWMNHDGCPCGFKSRVRRSAAGRPSGADYYFWRLMFRGDLTWGRSQR